MGLGQEILLLLLALLPASELAIQFVTLVITKILQPYILPKFSFDKGIPEELKTLVVVPSLLTTENDIADNIHQLEIHFLANGDKPLKFGIFYDYIDAPQEHMPEDQALLEIALKGFQALEDKYGSGKFFFFFRDRSWSKSEHAWIGRERKRGKIECLNRFLVEDSCSEMILKMEKKKSCRALVM